MRIRLLGLIAVCVLSLSACGQPDDHQLTLWITRFDYRTADDVTKAIADAKGGGFDKILFQVRGNATTFYPSKLEPWALELGGVDPGFDPLQLALNEARRHDIELHAWINVTTGWWDTELPAPEYKHLYTEQPAWFWYDQYGERQAPSERFYVSLNPCLPEVRSYLTSVCEELLVNYPALAGLHLDYIRFPNEPPATQPGQDFPRDPKTLTLFREATGKLPDEDPEAWNRWRSDSVTRLVSDIHNLVERVAPHVELSAAVGPEPERALHHFQDVEAWITLGLVDRLFPMNYTTDDERFDARLDYWASRVNEVPVTIGMRMDAGPHDVRMAQFERTVSRFGSVACFAYSSLYDSPNVAIDAQDSEARAERGERRRAWEPLLQRWTLTPIVQPAKIR